MQCLTIYIYAGFAHGTKKHDAFDGNNNIRVRETTFKNRTPNQPFEIGPYQYKNILLNIVFLLILTNELRIIISTQMMVFQI